MTSTIEAPRDTMDSMPAIAPFQMTLLESTNELSEELFGVFHELQASHLRPGDDTAYVGKHRSGSHRSAEATTLTEALQPATIKEVYASRDTAYAAITDARALGDQAGAHYAADSARTIIDVLADRQKERPEIHQETPHIMRDDGDVMIKFLLTHPLDAGDYKRAIQHSASKVREHEEKNHFRSASREAEKVKKYHGRFIMAQLGADQRTFNTVRAAAYNADASLFQRSKSSLKQTASWLGGAALRTLKLTA